MLMIRSSRRLLIGAITVVAGLLGGCASLDEAGRSRLDLVKQSNELLCGVSGKIPGFSFLTPEGTYTGRFRLARDGKVILTAEREIEVR